MPQRLDRLLLLAAALLVGAIAWTGLRTSGRRSAPPPAPVAALRPASVPEDVRLVPSSTALLPHCPPSSLHLSVGTGGTLALGFAGSRCHVPPLRLRAVERDAAGTVVYDGPALAFESLSGNYAVRGRASGRLLGPCDREPLRVVVSGSGLRASGRCGP